MHLIHSHLHSQTFYYILVWEILLMCHMFYSFETCNDATDTWSSLALGSHLHPPVGSKHQGKCRWWPNPMLLQHADKEKQKFDPTGGKLKTQEERNKSIACLFPTFCKTNTLSRYWKLYAACMSQKIMLFFWLFGWWKGKLVVSLQLYPDILLLAAFLL